MNADVIVALLVGFANGLLGTAIFCAFAHWLLGRVFAVADPRWPAFLFVLGLTLGRFEDAADMAGHPAGRLVGDMLGFALIWYLWWRRPAVRADAMERP
ncbi:hypothetical protein QE385_000867 [Sphingomonas sp. SORGH_AS 950]|uniref:hypothetical protein n=1 Tax=Sphingomonas sp. SORGH_AS_0950 TaxID=3041792 RepID=UPI0027814CFA|nr:hypothetical protein [Sphingomonas sp. SORGH_AS_0950]MDQ1156540.1 hypothetical protein [Sphingomonas sp. SORGH_AS_0950]